MKLGLFTVLYPELDLESILELAQQLGCGALEFSSLPGRGLRHFDPVEINQTGSPVRGRRSICKC